MEDMNGNEIEVGDYVLCHGRLDHMVVVELVRPNTVRLKFVVPAYQRDYFIMQAIYLYTFTLKATSLVKVEPEDLI